MKDPTEGLEGVLEKLYQKIEKKAEKRGRGRKNKKTGVPVQEVQCPDNRSSRRGEQRRW